MDILSLIYVSTKIIKTIINFIYLKYFDNFKIISKPRVLTYDVLKPFVE